MCSGSCSREPRAPPGSRPTSTSTSRGRRSRASTGATSTAASAGRWRAPASSSPAIWRTRPRGSRRSRTCATADAPRSSLHGDARELALGGPYDGVITSPPYPGLIDYHEQHRYAYELLGLDDRRERELGAAARGTSKAAVEEYVAGIAAVLARSKAALRRGAPVCIVVNDRRGAVWRDPGARRVASRRAARAARQPPDGTARGRVLRVDPDLPLAAYQPSYGGSRRSTSFQ